ncbi:MAG: hypothetical protein ACD_62C00259G0001 [uncultured bacterium]|nr:MAG: hypothetical protein ACD_62C00259G0001 [uncultured bacterium]
MAKMAALGPNRILAKTAPIRCPDVPPATGKLSICAAKINAAVSPMSGIFCGGYVLRTCLRDKVRPMAEREKVVIAVLASMKPSGMCIEFTSKTLACCGDRELAVFDSFGGDEPVGQRLYLF